MEVVVNKRDGFEYGRQTADPSIPDILRFGQVILLKGLPNDTKLMDIGYFVRFDKETHKKIRCDCGRDFCNDSMRTAHLHEHAPDKRATTPVDHVVNERREEEMALEQRGMTVRTLAGAKQQDQLVKVSQKPCPVGCGQTISAQGMRMHVIACQGKTHDAAKPVVARRSSTTRAKAPAKRRTPAKATA